MTEKKTNGRFTRWYEDLTRDHVPEVGGKNASLGEMIHELKEQGDPLTTGLAIGQGIASGKACVVRDVEEIDRFEDDAILVTEMTDPDWVPIMKRASGIITDHGGRTSHAAIVSRELGVPAAVGTQTATENIEQNREITLSCAEGDEAVIYDGKLDYDEEDVSLECQAIRRVREQIGMKHVVIMIPFCRTPEEADRVLVVLRDEGLRRGEDGLEVYCMAEIPSNVILAEQFADRFDGFSIGSNDLTQLVLGVGRDSAELRDLFNERHEAVQRTIANLISDAHAQETKVGICGQAPSDYPSFAAFLVERNIDSISLNSDSMVEVTHHVAEIEDRKKQAGDG